MLLLNGQSVSARKFCTDYGLDYDKIMRNPVFELHKKYQKKDKANGNVIKIPARLSIPAKSFVRVKEGEKKGETLELRYAENRNYRTINKERVEVFAPRYINIDTVKHSAKGNEDLAVFMYSILSNTNSPFGAGKGGDYAHLDPTAIAKTRMEQMSNVTKVLSVIENMDEAELIILAKGIQATIKTFNPFVDGASTDIGIVRVEMMTYAQLNATYFLEMLDNKIAKTKGQIVNLVDKGIIKEFTSQNTRQWKWEKGERAGNPIGDQIVDPHANSLDYLLNYILSNLGQYHADLTIVNNGSTAEDSALAFLKTQKEEEYVPEIHVDGLPTDFKSTMAWLGDKGYRKRPQLAKQVNDGIQDGTIHNGNVNDMVKKLDEALDED